MRVFRSVVKKIFTFFRLSERLQNRLYVLSRFKRPSRPLPSETSKCRDRLSKFCTGCGLDIGFGGDPIVEHAIRIDLPHPYAERAGPQFNWQVMRVA